MRPCPRIPNFLSCGAAEHISRPRLSSFHIPASLIQIGVFDCVCRCSWLCIGFASRRSAELIRLGRRYATVLRVVARRIGNISGCADGCPQVAGSVGAAFEMRRAVVPACAGHLGLCLLSASAIDGLSTDSLLGDPSRTLPPAECACHPATASWPSVRNESPSLPSPAIPSLSDGRLVLEFDVAAAVPQRRLLVPVAAQVLSLELSRIWTPPQFGWGMHPPT